MIIRLSGSDATLVAEQLCFLREQQRSVVSGILDGLAKMNRLQNEPTKNRAEAFEAKALSELVGELIAVTQEIVTLKEMIEEE